MSERTIRIADEGDYSGVGGTYVCGCATRHIQIQWSLQWFLLFGHSKYVFDDDDDDDDITSR